VSRSRCNGRDRRPQAKKRECTEVEEVNSSDNAKGKDRSISFQGRRLSTDFLKVDEQKAYILDRS